MSLFGEDISTETPSRRAKQHNTSLFDTSNTAKPPGELFGDADGSLNSDTPWSLPTPRQAARSKTALIKTLLPVDQVPDIYVDVYDRLLAESVDFITTTQIRALIDASGIDQHVGHEIAETIIGADATRPGREEINVLLALIGMAQEGDEATLDGVDERRRNLPIPDLGLLTTPKPVSDVLFQSPSSHSGSQSPKPGPVHSTPISNQSRRIRQQSLSENDSDPWASPDLHRGHHHDTHTMHAADTHVSNPSANTTSKIGPRIEARTTSAFSVRSETGSDSEPLLSQALHSNTNHDWNDFTGRANTSLGDSRSSGGFADTTSKHMNQHSSPHGKASASTFSAPKIAPATQNEVITITALAEKEGIFLFQHRNYQVTSARRRGQVTRRYSDFVWLLDCLHKRYPFRQLPLLPPKRYATDSSSFIEKRRRGLVRFTNALVGHPVLSQEQLVIMFLTVPTEVAVWRKQASISIQDEFTSKSLPLTLEDSLPANLQEMFDRVRTGVSRSAEQYINLCNIMERMVKRKEGMAAEQQRISNAFQLLTAVSGDTYAADSGDMIGLNLGLSAAAKHVSISQGLLVDEARAWDAGVLEDLKKQRDCLVSLRDVFERRDRYDRDNIPQLEKRIQTSEARLSSVRNKPDGSAKPEEAQRIEEAILKDKQSIVDQHARGLLIKECIRDEIGYFQSSQYHISRLQQDWAAEQVKYAELQSGNWRAFADEVESMPLGDS